MAKFLTRNATTGRTEEQSGVTTSAGAGDVGKIPQLDAAGKLDTSVMPSGIGAETESATASEALTAGNFVNIYDNVGVKSVRRADATTAGKEANGFVLTSFASSATATIYTDGSNNQLTGLTPGVSYYLSNTPGGTILTPLTGVGQVHQKLGKASTATSLIFEHFEPITLA
jgi:hypothetical protein